MMLTQLYKHNDTWYKILRQTPAHTFEKQHGVIDMELLKAWRDYLGGDHVLREQNHFLICETIPEAQIVE